MAKGKSGGRHRFKGLLIVRGVRGEGDVVLRVHEDEAGTHMRRWSFEGFAGYGGRAYVTPMGTVLVHPEGMTEHVTSVLMDCPADVRLVDHGEEVRFERCDW